MIPLNSGDPSRPLFCIHGIDGGVYMHRYIAKALEATHKVYAIQAKGLPITCVVTDDGWGEDYLVGAVAAVRDIQVSVRDVATSVPEPSTIALFAMGLVSFAVSRRKRAGIEATR